MSIRTSNSKLLLHLIVKVALCSVAAFLLLPRSAYGQATQEHSELDNALSRVKSGDFNGRDVVVVADARAVQAMPALEDKFSRATDVDTKVYVASGLVKLGNRNETYWNFLLEQATFAVDSNIPDSVFSESQAKMTNQAPELQVWADTHRIPVTTANQYARFDIPGKVLELGITGDPRGIPLLRRALQARNYLMVTWAAKGLAQIQDKESIPFIIAAVQKAPAGYDAIIAESLLYFDDVQAQRTFDSHVSKQMAAADRDAKAHGRGVFGWQ